MRVLVVNAGSSSLKLAVVSGERVVDSTQTEQWGGDDAGPIDDFVDAVGDVDAVGHRVVHGGPDHASAARVDQDLVDHLQSIGHLAPLHNPPALQGIAAVGRRLPQVPAVACFDTTFHADLPAAASTYALPREWNQRWGLRRYGFHGLSHAYAARRAAELVGRSPADLRIVTCHLGSGASLCAVRGGRSVDTTMGFTPLEGLVMSTRSGSVDPGLLLWLLREQGVSVADLDEALERRSGLLGLSGVSGDLREVLASDRAEARLAYDVLVHRLVREIGAMVASCGGLDVLVMTGGIGEHAPRLRADTVGRLDHLGLALDEAANDTATGDDDVTRPGAAVRTLVVAASEETEVARQTRAVLER